MSIREYTPCICMMMMAPIRLGRAHYSRSTHTLSNPCHQDNVPESWKRRKSQPRGAGTRINMRKLETYFRVQTKRPCFCIVQTRRNDVSSKGAAHAGMTCCAHTCIVNADLYELTVRDAPDQRVTIISAGDQSLAVLGEPVHQSIHIYIIIYMYCMCVGVGGV
jgi:hypothetical protein